MARTVPYSMRAGVEEDLKRLVNEGTLDPLNIQIGLPQLFRFKK